MSINRTARLLALGVAYVLAASAWAQKDSIPAPELRAEQIPGLLDIDFRCENITLPSVPGLVFEGACADYERRNIISVSAPSGKLTYNETCSADPSDAVTNLRPDGYGIHTASKVLTCDDGIGKGETLLVNISAKEGCQPGTAGATCVQIQAAFDVSGVWLTDFRQDKNGESGAIKLTLAGENNERTFSFTWKDASYIEPPTEANPTPNPNDEFFVSFGETLRMTQAAISGNVGSFSVAGFSQQPVKINTNVKSCGDSLCNPEIARNVRLELEPVADIPEPGKKGVTGTLFKEGVYVIRDTRPQCQPPESALAGPGNADLPIDITGNGTPDLVMLPHQCGHPAADSPGLGPVIYVLDLDGSGLTIAEDTITAIFDDDSNNTSVPDIYVCNASDPAFRPGIGWLPKSQKINGQYTEIPVFGALGEVVFDVQDITVGPCGSSRGSVPRYSYIVYNWVNRFGAANTTPHEVISDRIDQLAAYVDDLFACVQQGVNQSTFSSDVGRISTTFTNGRYERALQYVQDMRKNVVDPRLNDEIGVGGCFFNFTDSAYTVTGPVSTNPRIIDANAVGNLLVQLNHLEWMIFTNYIDTPERFVRPDY